MNVKKYDVERKKYDVERKKFIVFYKLVNVGNIENIDFDNFLGWLCHHSMGSV